MIVYENRASLMIGLAALVADQLRSVLAEKGRASLALPGGTTPAPFMRALSIAQLDWGRVAVMLGDERFVDENSERSNTRLLKENFLRGSAASAQLIPLYKKASTPEEAFPSLIAGVAPHLPIDVLVVGMGEDMHTASLFPDSPDLGVALAPDAAPLAIIRAENAGEPRMTLTAPVLRAAKYKHLLITGEAKLAPLERARNSESEFEAPIRVVISGGNPAAIHFAK